MTGIYHLYFHFMENQEQTSSFETSPKTQGDHAELFVQIDEVHHEIDGLPTTDLVVRLDDNDSFTLDNISPQFRSDIERLILEGGKTAQEIYEIISGWTHDCNHYGPTDL